MRRNNLFSAFLIYAFLLVSFSGIAQEVRPLKKEKFHFHKQGEDEWGYAQAVKVGNTIHVSGTAGNGPMDQSIKRVYENLTRTLQHYGLGLQHVVKETIFTTDIEALKKNAAVRKEFYRNDFPASSWIQIDRLLCRISILKWR